MNDFFVWFLTKHNIASALLFPELSFVWSLWMRQYQSAAVLLSWVVLLRIYGISITAIGAYLPIARANAERFPK